LVNYKINSFEVNGESIPFNNVNFHIPTLIEEVKQLPKSEKKEYKRVLKTFLMTASSFMILPLRSMAASSVPTTATNLPKSAEGLPPELLALLLKLLVISVGASVILAAILLVGAGVMKMFRKKKEANEWTVDIIKGLIQILVAVPVVFLIYYVATNLFSGSGWFVSPF
jgi:Na+-driven multidrug efflux pump